MSLLYERAVIDGDLRYEEVEAWVSSSRSFCSLTATFLIAFPDYRFYTIDRSLYRMSVPCYILYHPPHGTGSEKGTQNKTLVS